MATAPTPTLATICRSRLGSDSHTLIPMSRSASPAWGGPTTTRPRCLTHYGLTQFGCA
jgi:hypothetical protein